MTEETNSQTTTVQPQRLATTPCSPPNVRGAKPKKPSRELRYFDALKRIASYEPPERLRRNSGDDYGLDADEAIEYAYQNVIAEAKGALKGMKRPIA